MPILDLSVEMVDKRVLYRYYRKPMVNFNVLMRQSAMPFKMKRTCLTQEVVRILRNTSSKHEESIKTHFLSELCLRMQESGYTQEFRMAVIKNGVKAYEKQVKRSEEGGRPLYRSKKYQVAERERGKAIKRMSWYKPFDSVLFCPPTPNSHLAKERLVAENCKKTGGIRH